jgi:hypothetical protein
VKRKKKKKFVLERLIILHGCAANGHWQFPFKEMCVSFILLEIKYSTIDNFACDNIWQLLDKIVNVTIVTISRSLFAAGPTTLEQRPVKYTRIGMLFATFFHTEILIFSNQNWSLNKC